MSNKLFRQQATETFGSSERINEYIRVTGPSLYIFLIALLVCVSSVCIWAFYGTVTDSIKVSGIVFPHQGVSGIHIPYEGIVTEVMAKRGRYVQKGENLLRFVHEGTSGSIAAPMPGVVLSYKRENESFKAFENCVYLLPLEETMQNRELIAYVTFKDLRKLKIGMEVQVSPIDLPREEYGYMIGRIIEIANYPIAKEDASSQFKVEQFVSDIFPSETAFEIKVLLDVDKKNHGKICWSHRHRENVSVTIGTFCDLQIITRKRPVYDLIFKLTGK